MAEKLTVEFVPRPECKVTGNRIVDIGFLLERTIELAEKHARSCTSGKLSIDQETRSGLFSTFMYKCNMCDKTMTCSTEDPKKPSINTGAVWGTLASGSTYKHTEELLSVMNIPPLSNKMFYVIQEDLSKVYVASMIYHTVLT